MTPEYACAYLSAIVDGEGTVTLAKNSRAIRISNTDPGIIAACEECCDVLGLDHSKRLNHPGKIGHLPCWVLSITGRRSIKRANELLWLRSEKKRRRLHEAATSYVYADPPSMWVLVAEYLSGQSVADLAKKHRRTTKTIRKWLIEQGVNPRSYSEAVALSWAKRRTA